MGRSPLVGAEGAHEVPETLPLLTCVDVHALEGYRPRLQATEDEPPQAWLDGDPVDHEQGRPRLGRVEHDRSQHELERGIDAYRAHEAGAWEPGGECRDGAFPEGPPDGCGTEQRQGTKVEEGPQDQHRAER